MGHTEMLRRRYKRLLARHGMPDMKFHMLRHIAGSLSIRETGNWKGEQKLLGHASMATTMQVYAHLFADSVTIDVATLNLAYHVESRDEVDDTPTPKRGREQA